MSQFERRPGEWVAKFTVRGETYWVPGSPFPSKKMALEAERAHRLKVELQPGGVTCAQFAERWLEEWPRKASSTRKLYAGAAARFAQHFGATPLEGVERFEARAWALGIPRNLSKILGTMYEDARNIGLVEHNPFSNLRLPATEKTEEIAPPSMDEYRRLLAACMVFGSTYASELRALIQFTAWTGLRASEIQGLKWGDIEARHVNVNRARKDDGSYGPPKNGKTRRIALPVEARVLDQVPRWEGSDFVFHTPQGKELKKGSLYYLWNKVRDTSGTSIERLADGTKPIRFHDLRHFAATQWLERGASHFDVSVLLGHTDGGALVMARYGHPSEDAATDRLLTLSENFGRSATDRKTATPHRRAG